MNDQDLVKLRDRIGLLKSGEPREVLQRLTGIWNTSEGVILIKRAIDDIIEKKLGNV